jgi:short-subunit dehydrogenase
MSERLAVITGASSGIGFELAQELAKRGYDLVISASGGKLSTAAEALRLSGQRVIEVQADLSTSGGVDVLWEQIRALGRPLDIACINAGVGVGGLFDESDLDAELNMIQLNCVSVVHLAKHVVRQMKPLGAGRILFTSSIVGELVAPREAVYAASKAFVLSFAQSLRYELKESGITVTALQPGPTDTDFFHRAGMENTEIGKKGSADASPQEVALQGIDALMDGKDQVYAGSMKTKIEGMLTNFVPGDAQAAIHEKMTKPAGGE